jgi:GNAT superfamily N-acetyltransferase
MKQNKYGEVQESNEALISMCQSLCEKHQPGSSTTDNRLVISWLDMPFTFYNVIFITGRFEEASELTSEVNRATTIARTKLHPGNIIACRDLLSGSTRNEIDAIFTEEGFSAVAQVTGMAGDLLPLEDSGHPRLRFERATNGQIITDLNCLAYNLPLEVSRASLLHPSCWQDAFAHIAYEGGRPVSTATTFIGNGCLYLAFVATVPDARRKGYADAVIRRSLQEAHKMTGIKRTLLHTSESGLSLYKRLGYYPVADFTFYMANHD